MRPTTRPDGPLTRSVLAILVLAALSFALAQGARAAPTDPVKIPGLPLDELHTVGDGATAGGLTVFPIYATVQEDLGEFISLPEALATGVAEVREVGGETAQVPNVAPDPVQEQAARPQRSTPSVIADLLGFSTDQRGPEEPSQQQAYVQQRVGGGATVNTLVIANKGDKAILVLAGTIVKGGQQDRQIGQDFVVQAKQTVPVDAFCVEHGRWTATRDGAATGGKFTATDTLAQAKVRSAGQYEQDQSKVWEKVAEVNARHGKGTDTGTLLATLESDDVRARQEKLALAASKALAAAPQAGDIVGLAWASGGEVKGVRWFASHRVYEVFAPTLLKTAAVEGVAVDGGAAEGARGKPAATEAKHVQAFVKAFEAAQAAEVRDTGSGNVNEYFRTDKGYKSETRLKGAPSKMPLSVDML